MKAKKIEFRVKKVAKQGNLRFLIIPKIYHADFIRLGENWSFDVIAIPLPKEEGGKK